MQRPLCPKDINHPVMLDQCDQRGHGSGCDCKDDRYYCAVCLVDVPNEGWTEKLNVSPRPNQGNANAFPYY